MIEIYGSYVTQTTVVILLIKIFLEFLANVVNTNTFIHTETVYVSILQKH